MIRLRKALNSRRNDGTGALDWLDSNRDGNRFILGVIREAHLLAEIKSSLVQS